VAAIYTPKDYDLTGMMADVVDVIRRANDLP
jgi:(2R)-ethylmalonyl-CoA mutase